jgi:hypothetical protein
MLRFDSLQRSQLLALVALVEYVKSCPPQHWKIPGVHTTLVPLGAAKHAKFSQETIVFAKLVKLFC